MDPTQFIASPSQAVAMDPSLHQITTEQLLAAQVQQQQESMLMIQQQAFMAGQ